MENTILETPTEKTTKDTTQNIKTIENYPLKEHTTIKIGGNARLAYFPQSVEEVYAINSKTCGEKIAVIGEGSNLLVSSQGVEEKVIITTGLKNYKFLDEVTIKAESGMKSSTLAKIMHQHSLTGLEFLIGIPGTVGGAVTMNSSAHGQIIEDVIVCAEVIDLKTCSVKTLTKEELCLGYRSSFVEKSRHLILSATFRLQKGEQEKIQECMDFHVNYRKERHPSYITEPNAGSTFRNPEPGVYIGKLFEEIGAKHDQTLCKEGGIKVSEKHANFLINTGDATSVDVSRLMARLHKGVKERFGYDLVAEIRYVGTPTQEEEEIWKNFTVH